MLCSRNFLSKGREMGRWTESGDKVVVEAIEALGVQGEGRAIGKDLRRKPLS